MSAAELIERARVLGVPGHLVPGLIRYVEQRVPTGGFLRACLENDYRAAVFRADDSISFSDLRAVALWLHNEAPSACHGSPEKVRAWLAKPPTELAKFAAMVGAGIAPDAAGRALRDGDS